MIARIALALVGIAAMIYRQGGIAVTHDGMQYLAPAAERKSPFQLRWLLPAVLPRNPWAWAAVSWVALVCTCLLFPGDLWTCAAWVALPWFRCMAAAPVLVDAPAFAMSLACRRWPNPLWGLGAAVSERMPVMAALMVWDAPESLLVVLVGMFWAGAAYLLLEPSGKHTMPSATERLLDWRTMLAPWGLGVAALLIPGWTLPEVALVAVAYGQMLVATDSVRMYQWAAPVVLPRAIAAIPLRLRLPAMVLHWLNPWAIVPRGQVLC